MMIPFEFSPTPEQRYETFLNSRLNKAKHLAERVAHFKKCVNESKLKDSDKNKILSILNFDL